MSRLVLQTDKIGFSMKTKEYKILVNACKSKKTLETYNSGLTKFISWLTENYPSIISWQIFFSLSKDDMYDILQQYILELKNKLNPNSVRCSMAPVIKIMTVNRVEFNKEYLTQFYPETIAKGNDKAYSLEMVQAMLQACATKKEVALLLFLAVGGVRAGVFEELRFGDVEDYKNGYKTAKIYNKYKQKYITLLTPEASKALDDYMEYRRNKEEEISIDSPLFLVDGDKTGFNPMKWDSVYKLITNLLERACIVRTRVGTRFDIAVVHGLRKFFEGALVKAGVHQYQIEKFMGHKTGLNDTYYKPKIDDLFEAYSKATPHLTISESLRKEDKIKKLEKENTELKLENKITEMTNRINEIGNEQKEMKTYLKQIVGKIQS